MQTFLHRRKHYEAHVFDDADASTYFSALETNGYTAAICSSLYSISFKVQGQIIDTAFLAIKAAGLWTDMLHWCPSIGNSAAQKGINARSPGTNDASTGAGSSGFVAAGWQLDGVNDHVDAGYDPETLFSDENAFSIGCLLHNDDGSSNNTFGARFSSTARNINLRSNDGSDNYFIVANSTQTGTMLVPHGGNEKGLVTIVRTSSTKYRLLKNGLFMQEGTATTSGVFSSRYMAFGTMNAGSPTGNYTGSIRHLHAFDRALTESEHNDLTNALTGLNN